MTYQEWINGNCGCGCHNDYQKIDNCDCDNILLEISNIKTDVIVVSGDVQNKLDISAYTPTDLSNYYTKEEVDELIPSTPSLSGYATEQWVLDKHYITGVDLSNYALKSELPVVPSNVSSFNNDAGYITNAYLTDYASKQWVENKNYLTNHQPLKTINGESLVGEGNIVISGGSGGSITVDSTLDPISTNPVENKAIVGALNGKLDASAYTPTDLSNYYNKQEVNALIPTVPSNVSTFNNDAGYITSASTVFNNYATTANTYSKTEVNSLISNKIICLTQAQYDALSVKAPDTLYLIYEV